jgi:hypothetical protein
MQKSCKQKEMFASSLAKACGIWYTVLQGRVILRHKCGASASILAKQVI